jgi:hypothetical protein
MGLEMADREETEELIAGMVDNADGTHTPILARDVDKAITAIEASEKLLPDNVLHITHILHNLYSLEIDLEPLGDFAPNTMLPIKADGSVAITQGKFIVGFKEGEPPVEADLFLVGDGRLILGGETEPDYECNPVTLSIEDENGWHEATKEELGGIDPGSVWKATRPDGEAINLHTILSSLVLLMGIQAAYDNMAEEVQPKEPQFPRQEAIVPRVHTAPNDRLAHITGDAESCLTLYRDSSDPAQVSLTNPSSKEGGKFYSLVTFRDEDAAEITESHPMTAYDNLIANAVSTLWKAGNCVVTVQQVAETAGLNGKTDLSDVDNSLVKQSHTAVTIDTTHEDGWKGIKDGDKIENDVIDGHKLDLRRRFIRTRNGIQVLGYEILGLPVLQAHAEHIGQYISFPQVWLKTLGTGSGQRNTTNNVLIKQNVITWVRTLQNPKGKSNTPYHTYDALFAGTTITPSTKTKTRSKAKGYVLDILADLKNLGEVESFSERTHGRERQGVTVRVKQGSQKKSLNSH